MAIKKFLDCMANYSQKLSSKENRFLYFAKPAEGEKAKGQEAEKDPETMSEQDFRKKLETDTGIKIGQAEGKKDGKDRVMFKLEDNIPRSFLYNKEEFGKKLRTLLKTGNPNEVKRAVYGKLLEISKKDVEKSAESIRKELSGDAAKKLKQEIDVKKVTALNEELAKRIGPTSTVGGPGEEKAPQPDKSKENIEKTNKEFIEKLYKILPEKYKAYADKLTWNLVQPNKDNGYVFSLEAKDKTNEYIVNIGLISGKNFIVNSREQGFMIRGEEIYEQAQNRFEEILNKHLGIEKPAQTAETGEIADDNIEIKENKDHKFYYTDKTGNMLFEGKTFDYAYDFKEGLGRVKINNKLQFINKKGKNQFEPKTFEFANGFTEDLAAVQEVKGGKYYFLNKEGKNQFGKEFDRADNFVKGLAVVTDGGKDFFINKTGNNAFADKKFDKAYAFHDGQADVTLGGKDFKIDTHGEPIGTAPSAQTPLGGKVEQQVDARLHPVEDFKVAETERDQAARKRQIEKINGLIQEDETQLSKVEGLPIKAENKARIKTAIEKNIASLKATLARLEKGEVLSKDGEDALKSSQKFVFDTRSEEEQAKPTPKTAAAPAPAPQEQAKPAPATREAASENLDAAKAAEEAIAATKEGQAATQEGKTAEATGKQVEAAARQLAAEGEAAAKKGKTLKLPNGDKFTGDTTKLIGVVVDKNGIRKSGLFYPAGTLKNGTSIDKDGYQESGEFDNEEMLSKGTIVYTDKTILTGEFDTETIKLRKGQVTFDDGSTETGIFDTESEDGDLEAGTKTYGTPNGTLIGKFKNGKADKGTFERQEGKYSVKLQRNAEGQMTGLTGRLTKPNGQVEEGTWDKDFKAINVKTVKAAPTPKAEPVPTEKPTQPEPAPTHPPEAVAEESDVVKSAEQIADAAAKLADEAVRTAKKEREPDSEKGEKRERRKRKNGQYVDVIIDSDGKRVEGTVITKGGGKFQGDYDQETSQIAFGRLTLPDEDGGGTYEGDFYEAPGKKDRARLEKGRHIIPGKLEELGNFYQNAWALQEGRRTILLPNGQKETQVGKFAQNGQLTDGKITRANGEKETWKGGKKVEGKTATPSSRPAEAAPKTPAENLTTAQAEGAKLEAPTGKTITLNEQQANAIKEASAALKLELLQATNPAEIHGTLEKLAAKLAIATKDTGIDKITFPEFDITWENKPRNQFGFETKENFDKLISKVTKYKKEKQGADAAEFIKFRREVTAYKYMGEKIGIKEQQRLKYKEISDTDYKVDKSVYKLGEDGIEEKWKYIKGHGKIDKMLTSKEGPFNLDKGQTARFIAQVVTEGSNETVTLEHIFKFATRYNEKFPKDYGDFMEKYEELGNKPSRNAAEEKEYREMFENVLSPAIELLEAISKLDYKGEKAKEKTEELSPEQKLIRTNLYEMFQYSEREPGKWEQLMGWIGGAKDEIPVMTDINGETKYLDRGIFRRSYDPKAAYKILLETRGAYTVDEKDNRTIDQAKMLAEVNKMIRLGGMSIAMQKLMLQEKKPLEELQKDPQYKEKLQKLVPSALGALNAPGLITKEHMEAFQLGFIISQEMKANREVEDIQRAFKEENDKAPEGQRNPMMVGMLKDLEKQGVSKDDIAKIDEKLLAMGAVAFKNGKFEAAGLALNTKISVRPGLTLTVGATASKEGVTPGAALTLSLYEGENFKAGVTGELDLGGIGLGANASWEDVNLLIGRAKITIMVGGRFGKELMLGVGVIITRRNVGLRIAENKANIEKETGLASPEWEAFKNSKGQPVEQRYELLKKVTKLYSALIQPLESTFNPTHEDIVYLIDSLKDKITDQAVDKIASSPWEFFHGAGLIATPYPPALMPVFVFKIGSAKVYIPNRSEIGKMRDSMSDKMMQLKLRKAVQDADKRMAESKPIERPQVQAQQQAATEAGKEVTTPFVPADQTGEQSYSPDGRLRTRIKGKSFEFAKNLAEAEEAEPVEGKAPEAEKAPKTEAEKAKDFNDKLRQAVEVQLGEEKDGRRELQVLNTHNKDVEVYIDPNMDVEELGLKVEGGKLILLGNIDNLVITRERFFMPFKSQKSEGSIKDIIILRNKGSVKGEITREWIEKYSGAYAEKIEGEAGFTIEKGYGAAAQANIKGEEALTAEEETALKTVSSKKAEAAKKKQESFKAREVAVVKTKADIEADKKEFEKRKTERAARAAEAKEMDRSTERRHKALGAIDQAQYDAQKVEGPKWDNIQNLVVDPKFRDELGKVTDDDEKIKKLIIDFAKTEKNKDGTLKYPELQDLEKPENAKLLNAGLMKALNEWFIALYKTGKENNKEIQRVLQGKDGKSGRIGFAKRVLTAAFTGKIDEINKRLPKGKKINLSAKDAADKITDKIYETIRGEAGKPYDFDSIIWEGENRNVKDIDENSILFSTTRNTKVKKGEGVLTKTIAYRSQIGEQGEKELEHGFIEAALHEYKLNEGTDEEQQIARLLLEMASPSPEQNIDTADKAEKFLRSPLAVKLASLETLMLVPELGKAKFDLISELYENIADQKKFAELFAKPEYKEATEAYKKVVQDVRDAETEGRPYEAAFNRGSDQYVLKLTMKSSIKAGAYARCANGSFSVKEDGEVQIFKTQKPGEVPPSREYPKPGEPEVPAEPIALFSESTEVVKSKQSKAILTAAITGLNKDEEKPEPKQEVHDKQAKQGAAGTVVEDKQAAQGAGLGNPAPSGTTYTVPGENKGTGLSH